MKTYRYLVSTNLSTRDVMADRAEITTNGELVFTVGAEASVDYRVVAAAAPGYWLRFWEIDEEGDKIEEEREDE